MDYKQRCPYDVKLTKMISNLSRPRINCLPVRGPKFHAILLHQPTACRQWTQPELTHTMSPGFWWERYTGTCSSNSSRRSDHDSCRILVPF